MAIQLMNCGFANYYYRDTLWNIFADELGKIIAGDGLHLTKQMSHIYDYYFLIWKAYFNVLQLLIYHLNEEEKFSI